VGAAEAPVGVVEAPQTFEEMEAGLLQLKVSSIPLCVPLISQCGCSSPAFFFAIRVSSAVPALAPVKALKLRMSLVTGHHSERAPRAAASVVAAGEPSHATTVAARPQ
jgi:hypothetical protein